MFYFLKLFWNRYAWHFIIFGGLFVLLVLWFFNSEASGSTTSSFSDILQKIFHPTLSFQPKPKKIDKQSKGEKKCREFLEFYFKKPFVKARPEYLLNPITNQPLELDCFNDELKIALEYNGRQHYEYNKMMHQESRFAFQNQKYRDHIKKELCSKFGIHLITVPYIVSEDDIPGFIYNELKKLNLLRLNNY